MRQNSVAKGIFVDSLVIVGALLITYGMWSIFAPAGFITGGAFLLFAGLKAN